MSEDRDIKKLRLMSKKRSLTETNDKDIKKDLTIAKDNADIKVRITREWQVKSADNKFVIAKYYLLLDEEGTQIQSTLLENSLIPTFTKNLTLGQVYMISKYNVEPENSVIPTFTKNLTLGQVYFDFRVQYVVRKLIKVSDMQTTKNGRKNIDILLANERDDKMRITLWENQARAFLDCTSEYKKPNVFVIVTSTSAKNMQGDIVLWSSSSTHYYFNIDHPDIVELRKNYKIEEDLIPVIVPFVKTQQQTMVENIERVKIAKLFEAKLPTGAKTILFTTEATVTGINIERGWYYTGCNKCHKTMPPSLTCTRCPQRTSPTPLFMVKAGVKDCASHTTFMLFERYVKMMISVSAEHLLNNDKNATQDVIHAVLNNKMGRKYVFKLTLNDKNTVKKYQGYTVTDVLEEITNEEPIAATSETDDNAEQLKDDIQEKRKQPTP
ncbi:hypothetical protein POM88_041015 [Heracleum sosnowskyi]|uniref:Replication factor A C-terminal domain-containing protein n=1 Tax=Heracleum sosnowskyi TaxID=360622 RepID=A0AAD8HDZ4_9APIA|nr:hypothetical protein POM88_041015 [Heracleum sosnowskyi]